MFPDRPKDLVLKLAGCWGPYNNQISHFETIFGYFSLLDVTHLDNFPPFRLSLFS